MGRRKVVADDFALDAFGGQRGSSIADRRQNASLPGFKHGEAARAIASVHVGAGSKPGYRAGPTGS